MCVCFVIREGLSTRSGTNTDEIQLRIDPMHSDLDDHISGLHSQVKMLRNVCIYHIMCVYIVLFN